MALPEPQEQLCFSPDELLNKDFQVDDFVSRCRKRVTMEGLRENLDSYFRTLKSAMVELINKDYADFVNLSANLAGMDKSISNLTSPLRQLQTEITDIKTAMEEAIQSVENKLELKSEIREKKSTLQRLIVVLESMEQLERLLHIQPSKDASEIQLLSQKGEWGPVVMERVATEFNKLQYNASLVKTHPLIEDSNERMVAITHSLQSWLETTFREGLEAEDRGALTSCLQTYTHIGRQEAAEAMFRNVVVHPYMEGVVTTKNLISHPQGLSGLYADILTFVPKHCLLLSEITSRGTPTEGQASAIQGFDFLVNSVWPEVASLIEQKTSVIFAPGNPDTFHQNYAISMEFVSSFEKHCSTEDSVKRLRAHPAYTSFMSKWSLPVYFQIRFQEIAGSLESVLVLPLQKREEGEVPSDHPSFKLEVFQRVWSALVHCWSPEVLIPALVHRFWKLSLQLLMRTALWLEGLSAARSEAKSDGSSSSSTLSLQDCLLIVTDLEKLSAQVSSFAHIVLPNLPTEKESLVHVGLDDARQRLDQLVPNFSSLIIEDIVSQCSANTESAQTIPRLYRRTNREAPSKPSTFVSTILRPLEQVLGEFPPKHKQEWTKGVIESVTENYYRVSSELLTAVKRTEESLLKLKAYRKSGAPTPSGGMTDDNKIRLQVALDIEHYSAQVTQLDIQCLQLTAVKQLLIMGQTSKSTALEVSQ